MPHDMKHCGRPWWKRPPVWVIAIAAVLLLIGVGVDFSTGGRASPMAYGVFLDQLEAGTIASVTIRGTEIRGRFKQPPNSPPREPFDTWAPDFGDPALIAELRKQHVAIEVSVRHRRGHRCSHTCRGRCWPSSAWSSSQASSGWRAAGRPDRDLKLPCRRME